MYDSLHPLCFNLVLVWHQVVPTSVKTGAKMAQVGPKLVQVRPKMAQVADFGIQNGPGEAQVADLEVQNGPWDQVKGCRDAPGMHQGCTKDAPRMHQGCTKDAPGNDFDIDMGPRAQQYQRI